MNRRIPSWPTNGPSVPDLSGSKTASGWTSSGMSTTSPRLIASVPRRKASWFSCDIAGKYSHTVRPWAGRDRRFAGLKEFQSPNGLTERGFDLLARGYPGYPISGPEERTHDVRQAQQPTRGLWPQARFCPDHGAEGAGDARRPRGRVPARRAEAAVQPPRGRDAPADREHRAGVPRDGRGARRLTVPGDEGPRGRRQGQHQDGRRQ